MQQSWRWHLPRLLPLAAIGYMVYLAASSYKLYLWSDWVHEFLYFSINKYGSTLDYIISRIKSASLAENLIEIRHFFYIPNVISVFFLSRGGTLEQGVIAFSTSLLLIGALFYLAFYPTRLPAHFLWLPIASYFFAHELFYSTTSNITTLSIAAGSYMSYLLSRMQEKLHRKRIFLGIAIFLAFVSLYYTHPISSAFLGWASILALLEGTDIKKRRVDLHALIFAGSILLLIALKHTIFLTEYERWRTSYIRTVKIIDLFNCTWFSKYLLLHLPRVYSFLLTSTLLVGTYLLLKTPKKALPLLGTTLLTVGAQAIYLNRYLPTQFPNDFHGDMYALILPFLLFAFIVQATTLLQKPWERILSHLLLLGIAVEALWETWKAQHPLSYSMRYIERIAESCRQTGERKALLDYRALSPETHPYLLRYDYFLAGSMCLTGLKGPDSAVALCFHSPVSYVDSLAQATQHRQLLGAQYWTPLYGTFAYFNPDYYRFPDTLRYKVITTPQDSTVYTAIESGKIEIEILDTVVYAYTKVISGPDYTVAEVRVHQTYAERIPCLPQPHAWAGLGYLLYDEQGKPLMSKPQFRPFERDLPRTYTQGVFLFVPPPGRYQVQIGLLSGKHGFLPQGRRIWLIVK
ncbi:MAG: hypothetical protein KatS3mg026_1692 [Bacteroidia bacterium]|nr:MAG: hypothetical protein KatS3mg026_1692 [Bacteroidia bacterium]